MKRSISEAVEKAEKEVHGDLIESKGKTWFDIMMSNEEYRRIIDHTVLQVAGVEYIKDGIV